MLPSARGWRPWALRWSAVQRAVLLAALGAWGDAGWVKDLASGVLGHMNALVDEDHLLHGGDGGDPARLREVEEEFDRCWGLLRLRRARREFGEDSDGVGVWCASTVKSYRQ